MYKVWLFNRKGPKFVPGKKGRLSLQKQVVCAEVVEDRVAKTDGYYIKKGLQCLPKKL